LDSPFDILDDQDLDEINEESIVDDYFEDFDFQNYHTNLSNETIVQDHDVEYQNDEFTNTVIIDYLYSFLSFSNNELIFFFYSSI
jgi:hypothetical protein